MNLALCMANKWTKKNLARHEIWVVHFEMWRNSWLINPFYFIGLYPGRHLWYLLFALFAPINEVLSFKSEEILFDVK